MKVFLRLFMLVCISYSYAQDISISTEQSEIFKDNKKHTSLIFSESDGQGGFVTIRVYMGGLMRTPKGYYIDHYNSNLELINETEIEIDKSEIKGLFIKNNSIYLLELQLDKDNDVYSFNVMESPLGSFNFTKRSLFTLNEDDIKKYFEIGIGGFFINNGMSQIDSNAFGDVIFSSDREYFAVNFDIKDKESQTQRLYVYDSDFNKVWEKDFNRDIKDKLFKYENIDIDTDGAIYLLGKVFENNSTQRKKKGKANYHFELFKIDETGEKSVSFKTDDTFVGSLFTVRGADVLTCAGFYSEKNDNRYKGAVRFNVNPETLEITEKSFQPFSEEFMNDKYGKVKDKELRNISFRGGFIAENGDLTMNAEEFYITSSSMMGANGSMTNNTIFHYDDILSIKMNKQGELLWARNINKRQATGGLNVEYFSFSATVLGNDTYLFINGSDKIKKLRNDRIEFKQASSKKANLYAIKINAEGDYSFENIVAHKDSEVAYFVAQGISISNGGDEMVFIGRRKSKKQFLKIKIAGKESNVQAGGNK